MTDVIIRQNGNVGNITQIGLTPQMLDIADMIQKLRKH